MATYTSNYGWTKPSGSDNVDISVLNDNLDDQDSTIHDAFLNMAPPFSESSTYAVDDIVLYTTGLYKCHTAVVTPGSWTGSTNWQVYKLSEGGSGGGGTSNYNDLTNKPSINGVSLSGNKTTSDLGINADNVMMSDGVTSVEDALDELTAITIGAPIDISGYSTPENLYKCPSDGYIRLIADVAVGNQTTVKFGDGYTLAKSEVATANHNVMTTVYVRKGMQFYCTRAETTYSKIQFLPIS